MNTVDTHARDRLAHVVGLVDERLLTLLDAFYDRLFAAHPDIKGLFGSAAREKQKEMLHRMLSAVIDLHDGGSWLDTDLRALGERHDEYEVCPHYYPMSVEALLAAMGEVLGDDWTPEDAEAWARDLNEVSRRMLSGNRPMKSVTPAPAPALPVMAPPDVATEAFEDADMLSLDLHSDDPWELYAWMRDEQPLFWDKNNELWAVSRYDDVVWVSRRTDLFVSGQGVIPKLGLDIWPDDAMINKDGDEHTMRRGLVSKAFTPRRIDQWEPRIQQITDALIDRFASKGECDLVRDFARPLPFRVIADMLGYPEDQVDDVLDWTDVYCGGGNGPQGVTEEVVDAFANFHQFHEAFVEEKRGCPAHDLISGLLSAEIDGQRLNEDQLLWEHNLLLVGGSETTRSAIAIGMQGLMGHPDQQKWLVDHLDDDKAVNAAVEELIRWSCPFVRMRRTAVQDVELHGKLIKAGDELVILYPSANRDPRAFPDADRFDVRRDPEKPALSFGIGKHYCLGASLARLDTRIALRTLLRRLPDIRPNPDAAPERVRSCFVRSLASFPVVFTPR